MTNKEFAETVDQLIYYSGELNGAYETLEDMQELNRPGKIHLWKDRIVFFTSCVEEHKNKVLNAFNQKKNISLKK